MHIFTFLKSKMTFVNISAKFVMFFAVMFVMSLQATAQVPANDEPCNATVLIANAACTFTNATTIDASLTTIPPAVTGIPCGNLTDADVWFSVVVPAGATSLVVDSKGTSLSDGAMAIYSGTVCTALTFLSCSDDGSLNPGFPKITIPGVTPGQTYWIRFYGFGGEQGTFGICVTANIPPSNDECLTATSLTVNPNLLCAAVTGGTTNNATQSATLPTPTCGAAGGFNDDVWFSFTSIGTIHRITLPTVSGGTSMTMALYSGTCAALTQIGCVNGTSLDATLLTPNTVYYVRVFTNSATTTVTATFNICVGTPPPPPANDECINAIGLTVNADFNCGVVTAGTTVSATQSNTTPNPTCAGLNAWNDDVWYSFVATNTSHRVSLQNVTGVTTDMTTAVYSGTCTNLTQIGCATVDPNVINLAGLTVNSTYFVRVMTASALAATTASFNICVGTPPPPPANDECPGAVLLTVNPTLTCTAVTAGTTISSTQSTAAPTPSCSATGIDDDSWFTFVATGPVHRISLLNVTGFTAMTMVLYSGTCGAASLVELACNTTSLMQVGGLVANQTYTVRVFTTTAIIGNNSNFNICVGTPPPPPANDECANAVVAPVNSNYTCTLVAAGNTASATQSTGAPVPTCSGAGINDDVWFQFTATNTRHRISLLNVTPVTPMASAVYSGTCSALVELTCSAVSPYNVIGLTINQVYYVRVWTTSTVPTIDASFNLCIGTPPPPPANDECTGAIPLTVNPNQLCGITTPGTTEGATQSNNSLSPTCSPANGWDDDVWFSFVATGASHTVSLLNVTGISTNMLTSVYAGTCGNLIQIGCATVDPNLINLTTLTQGTTYWVRVQTELAGPFDASFSVCVGTPGPGSVCVNGNPFCSTSGVTYPSVTNQPSLGGGGVYGCLGTTPNPTWFYMQVSSPGNLVFQVSQVNTAGTGIDVDYAAWGPFTSQADGCTQIAAANITPISCSYSTAPIETITIPNALVGQFYIVLITNFNGSAGQITFNTTTGNVGSTNCNIVCNTTASNSGPVCVNSPFNLFSTAIAGSTFSWTGPGGFTSTVQNPTGVIAPATAGSYTYTVTTTNGNTSCAGTTTVVVTANVSTLTLSSAATTTSQSVCTGTAITPITYTTGGGATGATVTGLPAGVTGSFAGGTFTISGTPTATGLFNYTVSTAGGCGTATLTGSITVTVASTLVLSSAAGSNNQTVCVNTAINNITYTAANGVTNVTATGLPAGVTGTFAGGVFTISGSPTAVGTFNYTVTSSGGCGTVVRTGTIVSTTPSTLTLSSAPSTADQSVCINTAITNITYTTGGGVTGASVTGLPAGITGTFAGGTFTISGTPTVAGSFGYTVTTTGGCGTATKSGTINVIAAATVTLTSPPVTANQTVCINTPITGIVYSVGNGATSATVTGLPAGVTGTFAGGVFTVSGTPTVGGVFPYTVSTMGGCGTASLTGTITVTSPSSLTLSSAASTTTQTVCSGTAIVDITYTVGGATGATVTGLPAGVTGTFAGGTFTISGTPTASGTFNYTVSTTGGCGTATQSGTITSTAAATYTLSSAAATANQTVCINTAITNITYAAGSGATGATVTGLPAGVTGS
ncbi:MAG: hypothetical protein WKF88_08265, partial [Ferruginibacter sp.]